MTDLQCLVDMLNRNGIAYSQYRQGGSAPYVTIDIPQSDLDIGYYGFAALFRFRENDGGLIGIGGYE